MTPFPIVRIQGRTTSTGVRISRLTVVAPPGTRLRVSCSGKRKGCPKRTVRRTITGTSDGSPRANRVRQFERRLRAGAVVRVYVTGEGVIGKYTRFKIRRGRAPARVDLCLMPGTLNPSGCPTA